jgi:hypothetical protein
MVVAVDGDAAARGGPSTRDRTAGTTGDGGLPDEVSPQKVQKRIAPVTKTKPSRRLEPGDLVCGQCGEGNPPTRKFCSRCGDELTTAEVVRTRWYRRLMVWKRSPKALEAGARPGQKGVRRDPRAKVSGGYRKLRRSLAALMLVAGMLYLAVPPLRGVINRTLANPTAEIKETVGGWWHSLTYPYDDLPVQRSSARDEMASHPGSDAFDGNTSSFWGARWVPNRPPAVTVRFEEVETIAAVVVHNGAAEENAAKFLQARVVRFRYGNGAVEEVELRASGDPQTLKLKDATTVKQVTISVREVFDKEGLRRTAISEIEFKTKK